jgi:hypothetical protein
VRVLHRCQARAHTCPVRGTERGALGAGSGPAAGAGPRGAARRGRVEDHIFAPEFSI